MLRISSAKLSFLTFTCENVRKSLCVPAHVIKFYTSPGLADEVMLFLIKAIRVSFQFVKIGIKPQLHPATELRSYRDSS